MSRKDNATMFAHYTATKTDKTVTITRDCTTRYVSAEDNQPNHVAVLVVTGKRHANAIAAMFNATPWNF